MGVGPLAGLGEVIGTTVVITGRVQASPMHGTYICDVTSAVVVPHLSAMSVEPELFSVTEGILRDREAACQVAVDSVGVSPYELQGSMIR